MKKKNSKLGNTEWEEQPNGKNTDKKVGESRLKGGWL